MCGLKPATNVRVKTRHSEAGVSYQFVCFVQVGFGSRLKAAGPASCEPQLAGSAVDGPLGSCAFLSSVGGGSESLTR